MAEHRVTNGKQRQLNETSYPDPTDDEAEPHPYPALRQGASDGPSNGVIHHDFAQRSSEAARQYLMLANHLPKAPIAQNGAINDAPPSDDEAEGVPMANRYLNLHPQLPETDQEDYTVDESELEAATDAEVSEALARTETSARGRGKTRKRGWKWALKGTAHDPALNREPKPRNRTARKGRRRKTLDPGHEFKAKQGQAMQAFLAGRYDEALEAARDAVHANPEIFGAHSLLSDILLAKGQNQDSLAALLSGAVTARDADTWVMVAERTLDYAEESRTEEVLQQAVFCYTQAIDLEKRGENNFAARVAKMQIWIELGEFTKARRDCKALVGLRPTYIDLVRQMAELCAMTSDSYETNMARQSYEYALEQAYTHVEDLHDDDLNAAWSHLNIYLELVDRSAMPEEAILITKRHARKFLGRSDEVFWDNYQNDDREMDVDHTRRYEIEEFQQGKATRDLASYGEGLPLELRIKLGLFRLKMDETYRAEAFHHFNHLKLYQDDVESFVDMFYLVATTLAGRDEHAEALQFFEPIRDLQGVLTDDFWMKYGATLKALSSYLDAAECYKKASEINPMNISAKVDLAHLYQGELKDKEKAWQLVDEIIGLNKKDLLRREKLHMRPRIRGVKSTPSKRQQADQDESSDSGGDFNPSADLAVQPVKARKRHKDANFVPAGMGSFGEFAMGTPDVENDGELENDARGKRGKKGDKGRRRKNGDDKRRFTKTNERKLEILESLSEKVSENYAIVRRLWPELESTQDQDVLNEWSEAALSLYEVFRSVKHFYPTRDKHKQFRGFLRMDPGEAKFMNEMELWKKQLESNGDDADGNAQDRDFADFYTAPKALDENAPKDFYDISFATWHHIFVDLALLYARRSRQAACYQIIDDGLYAANVFYHDPDILNTTQATSMACGFIFNDNERLCFAARWFLNRHDLRPGSTFQLFSAANRLSYGSSMWFSAGPTQKHMLRSIKALDYHVFTPEVRKKFDWSLQLPTLRRRVEKYGSETGHLDANALLTYGHMVGVANHSQSALPYFFRAYALQPENVTVSLSIATMYIQNSMKRQTDNRLYGISQGLSFLYSYYDQRIQHDGALERQEAEYNVGRCWHMLGLTHLAIGSYQRTLALSEAVRAENEVKQMQGEYSKEDFTREAAYALVNLYAVAGNDESAAELTEKWLVL